MSDPRPAATVVLLRPGPNGLEALLTHRPSTMAFAPDVQVFPGGGVDAADHDPELQRRSMVDGAAMAASMGADLTAGEALAAAVAAIREAFEEVGILLADVGRDGDLVEARRRLIEVPGSFPEVAAQFDLTLRTDLLVPLSRWVTPPIHERRFDARFFVAPAPDGVEATLVGEEVVAHAWHRPIDALDAMARGELAMWLPTSTTLTQLRWVDSIEQIARRMTPRTRGAVEIEEVADDVVRITMPAGGGVAGQPVHAYVVGRQRMVLIDPGDPTGAATDRVLDEVRRRGGEIAAIALTHADADHIGGAEGLREQLGIEILVGRGGGRYLPHEVVELEDGTLVEAGDVPLRVVATPGPAPEHLAFVVGEGQFAVTGDLDGRRGARSVLAPPDREAWTRSEAALRSVAPDATWLGGHPRVDSAS